MDSPSAARLRHRLVSYALVAALSCTAMLAPSVSEAGAPEERREASDKQNLGIQDHQAKMFDWLAAAREETDEEPSVLQSWLTDIYIKLVGLKAAITSAIPHAWKWSQGKSSNACR